jgi:integrase
MKYSVTPVIRKDQTNQQGECPLYIRYTAYRKSINIPLGESILLSSWDFDNNLPKTSYKQFRQLFERINLLMDKIHEKVGEFETIHSRKPECSELKGVLFSIPDKEKNQEKRSMIFTNTFKEFIHIRGKGVRSATITVYHSTLQKWKEFELIEKRTFYIEDISGKLLQNFRLFLIGDGKQLSTVGKYIKTLKTFINWYLIDYLNLNVDITYKKTLVDREEKNTFEVLSEIELESLKEAVFYSRYKVKDSIKLIELSDREKTIGKMFLFMCNTGLAYCDLQKLSYADIHIEVEELTDLNQNENEPLKFVYLQIERTKTIHKAECIIPIIGTTIDLLVSQMGLRMEDLGAGNLYLTEQDRIQILEPLHENIKHTYQRLKPNEKLIFPTIHSTKFNKEIKKLLCKLEINELVSKVFRGVDRITTKVPKYEMISAHSGRRTYITLCLRQGVLPDVLMQSTGHKKFDTMRSYHKHNASSVNKEIRKKIRN